MECFLTTSLSLPMKIFIARFKATATGGGDVDSFQKTPKSRGEVRDKRQTRTNTSKRSVVGGGDGGESFFGRGGARCPKGFFRYHTI